MQNVSGDNGKCFPLALFNEERTPDTILVYIHIVTNRMSQSKTRLPDQ